jgi:hypothetical protein
MALAVALIGPTIPLAGVILAGKRERWSDLFIVSYIAAMGLLLSAAAMLDDSYDLTTIFGLSTDALASF